MQEYINKIIKVALHHGADTRCGANVNNVEQCQDCVARYGKPGKHIIKYDTMHFQFITGILIEQGISNFSISNFKLS